MRFTGIIALLILSLGSQAQIFDPCVDSTRVNRFFPCGPVFQPVCGCDGRSYVNDCVAYNRAGVNRIEYSGVCQQDLFIFDFWPNPVVDVINFHMQLAAQQSGDASIQVVDIFGNVVYFKLS